MNPVIGKEDAVSASTYHWKMKELPGCFFSAEGERSYDRSIRRFIAENR